MICIFSTTRDQTTTEVMRWLSYLGVKDVLRINSDDTAANDRDIEFNLDQNTLSFRDDGRLIRLSEIEAVWYRKGRHWLCNQFLETNFRGHPKFAAYLEKKIAGEQLRLSEYLHFMIETAVPVLGSSTRSELNKLLVLHAANEVGLLTPAFHISNSKASIIAAIAQKPSITKPITDVLYLFDTEHANTGYYSYTEALALSALDQLPDRLSPSFVQEQILKRFDVRVFFLDGRFYAMAIFSQRDEQTRVDFRRYNDAKPNRTVPLKLSSDLEEKIARLFASLNLNTGSVDFVVDLQGRFFFLEINPVGQFSMVFNPCNYFLEKQVAITLKEYARQHKFNPTGRKCDKDNGYSSTDTRIAMERDQTSADKLPEDRSARTDAESHYGRPLGV
jgi:ATP-GRASP peptide maturase of grasp-with-spasm system